jgi:bifunctional non-homologous end joining protein LigD
VGRAGSGFTEKQLEEISGKLMPLRRPAPPCSGLVPDDESVWVEPARVAEVRYLAWTADRLLRQPVFLRLRDDKRPEECTREPEASEPEPLAPATASEAAQVEKKVAFSNLDKVFWPEEGYTKGDLIEYYRAISPWLLPYLADRPLVLTRYPDGIQGKFFFQKDAPGFVPGWMHLERMWSEQAQRELDCFVCDDLETLLYLANLAAIPLHVWASRVRTLQNPDWCILDLDPKQAPFAHVVEIARAIRALCEELGLPAFIKTSGATGLHVLLPLGRQMTFEQAKQLGELLARVIAAELPEIATIVRNPAARGGKVYVDFLQNGHGKTIAGPFSARPVPGATCSAPLSWDEVDAALDPKAFTLRTLPARMQALGGDPLRPVLDLAPDLPSVLFRLADRLARAG